MSRNKVSPLVTTVVDAQPSFMTNGERKAVGILGGNFNPVHYAHLIIADQVYHQLGLDKIYLMPSFEPPHVDQKTTINAEDRIEMLKKSVATNNNLDLELTEIRRQGKSYTYDTMKELIERNPDVDYYFIIGGDMVEYLPKWHRIAELVDMVQFVGIKRPQCANTSPYPIIWVDVPAIDISSSLIRKKVAAGCSIKYFTPDSVIDYIQEKGLYLDE